MSDPNTPANVKVYDRPERKAPSPIVMVLALLIVLVLGFLVYKMVNRSSDANNTSTSNNTSTNTGAASSKRSGAGQ